MLDNCRTISLGKFGSFKTDQLIGKPFGPSWEILPSKELKLLERDDDEEGQFPIEYHWQRDDMSFIRDNRDVFDDGNSQLLSAEEIRQARLVMSSKV